jgi:hypothetical protein
MENPIVKSEEYQKYLKIYKENLLKYQPGPRWYFGGIESGIGFNDKHITIEEIKKMAERVSPIGPEVHIDQVENVTPSWDWLCKTFPDPGMFFDYEKYQNWIDEQTDVFYYSRGRENFSSYEAYSIAAKLGYRKVIMEDLS